MFRAPRVTRTRRRAATPLTVVALACLAVTGCSSSSDAGPASAAPSVQASDTPTAPRASPAAQPGSTLPTSFPKQQLAITELPKAKGPVKAALRTYLSFESLVRESLRSHHVSPRLRTLASTPLFHTIVASANNMQRKSIELTGPTDLAVTDARGTANIVALNLCFDVTHARQVVNGTPKPLDGPQRAKARSVLTNEGGTWRVTEYTFNGDAC